MQLIILAIGRKKSEYDPMIAEYRKRITAPYSLLLEIIDPAGLDHAESSRVRESEKLTAKLKPGDFVIVMDEHGKEFTTASFAQMMEKQLQASPKRIVFVIGGSYGLDASVITQANLVMRLGALTLPHELARLVLAEQLYRVTNLLGAGKYHHH